jgi:hypothetical protein
MSCILNLNPEKGLAKLPKDDKEVKTNVQKQLLEKLSSMFYNRPAISRQKDNHRRIRC